MPLYEYRCPSCEHRFEVLQRIGEGGDDLSCTSCGRVQPEKLLSTFAGHAKGEGSSATAADSGSPGCGSGFS